jgi:DinB family protein
MMKKTFCLVLLFAAATSVLSWTQTQSANKEEKHTIGQVMDRSLSGVEKEFVDAADAMPEDKYSYAPTNGEFKGVRTFSQQVKHVAAVNFLVASSILDEKPPVELGGENGPDSVKSKAEIMKFLRDSFAFAHRAMVSVNAENVVGTVKSPFGEGRPTRLGLATLVVGHCFDHYGQMVEYLRSNGVVPPASRGQ